MQISEYLNEIHHAVETILCEIHRERRIVDELQEQVESLSAVTEEGYRRVEFFALNPELDDDGLGTAIYWDTYFGPDRERYYKVEDLEKANGTLSVHKFSIASLAGSLLDYAKQGIVLRFGKERKGCPDGRIISDIPLQEVIWQGRNQASHWPEGRFNAPVCSCFEKLSKTNEVFREFKSRCMAYEVICLLGWNSYDDFSRDMKLFE